jgi:ABC-type branched-subunit amino acid transport system ATPase component
MIEHVMQAVMNLAEHVWVLAQGQLIAAGTPADVTRDARVIEAYLGPGAARRLAGDPAMTVPLLDVQDLRRVTAASRCCAAWSLQVHAGEIVALLGSNGAGKSTLNNTVCGLVRASAGRCTSTGQDSRTATTARWCRPG